MKYVRWVLAVLFSLPLWVPLQAWAVEATPPSLLIVEMQVSGSGEFIELTNTSDQNIDVSNWQLEYFTASTTDFSTTPTNKVLLHGIVGPGKRFLLAKNGFSAPLINESFSFSLADSGAYVRLTSPNPVDPTQTTVHDFVGWKSTTPPVGSALVFAPHKASDPDKSLQRKTNSDGTFINTANAAADFDYGLNPTPEADALIILPDPDPIDPNPASDPAPSDPPVTEPPVDNPADSAPPIPSPDPAPPASTSLLPPQVTELLPNPAPPQTDDADEFIELFNPNAQEIDLTGYKLQSGNTFSYSYTFPDETIPANSYRAFWVSQTGLILANSSGKVRLLDPNGTIIGETNPYADAKDGEAWALIDSPLASGWQWTLSPTPGAANVLSEKPVVTPTTKTVAAPKTTTKTATVAKPKATTTAKAATTKKPITAKASSATQDPATLEQTTLLHPAILAGIGGLALGYALWEYRRDIANRFYQFKRYRTTRRETRAST